MYAAMMRLRGWERLVYINFLCPYSKMTAINGYSPWSCHSWYSKWLTPPQPLLFDYACKQVWTTQSQVIFEKPTTNSNLLPAQFPFFPYLPSELNKNYMLDFAFFFPVKNFNYRSISFYVSSCCNLASFLNVTHARIVLFYSRSWRA